MDPFAAKFEQYIYFATFFQAFPRVFTFKMYVGDFVKQSHTFISYIKFAEIRLRFIFKININFTSNFLYLHK